LVKYDLNTTKPVMHKNRNKLGLKYSELQYGDVGFKFEHEGQFEIKYLFLLKRSIRKNFRRKRLKKRR